MLGRTRRIHFVGIGGIGMSGIAELLANLGYAVSGSDSKRSEVTIRLQTEVGITVQVGHEAAHVGDADVVVVSSAVPLNNPEVVEAGRRGIPVIPRAEMLAELMRLRFSIAVAGSHGKTTTTAMIAYVLERAGLDPTAVIGGRLKAFGSNARLGQSNYMVAEADESDRSFLLLSPSIAVITNIDREHLESYGGLGDLQQAFVNFANKVPFYGAVVACADDEHVAEMIPALRRRAITYGLRNPAAHILGADVSEGEYGARCVVSRRVGQVREGLGNLEIVVPGRHNLQNALAVVAVAGELGVEFGRVAAALADFQGADRRFQRHPVGDVLVVDDYGHHPTEIAAVLAAARASLARRLVVAFQPHRYSRTHQLMESFGPALAEADEIVLTDIYSAGEEPIPGVTVEAFAEAVRRGSARTVRVVKELEDLVPTLLGIIRPGDAVILLGAGSIGTFTKRLVDSLAQRGARA
jgi:UDP-N-acetylmuramate--alanine ligase